MGSCFAGLVIPTSLQCTTSFLAATFDNRVIEGEHGIDYACDMTGKDATETTESLVHVLLGSDIYGPTLETRRQDLIADSGTVESFSCVYHLSLITI